MPPQTDKQPFSTPRQRTIFLRLAVNSAIYALIDSRTANEVYCPASPFWDARISHFLLKAKACPHLSPLAAIARGFTQASIFCPIQKISAYPPSPTLTHHPEWGEPFSPHYIIALGSPIRLS